MAAPIFAAAMACSLQPRVIPGAAPAAAAVVAVVVAVVVAIAELVEIENSISCPAFAVAIPPGSDFRCSYLWFPAKIYKYYKYNYVTSLKQLHIMRTKTVI